MREIKFRAWVRFMQKIGRVDELNLESGSALVDIYPYSIESDAFDLMQYTGLKDKNGVEIYEGDIVKWGHIDGYTERMPRIAIVSLDPSLNFITINLGENNHDFHYGIFAYANCIDRCMEVIGNIHQNPELLEK